MLRMYIHKLRSLSYLDTYYKLTKVYSELGWPREKKYLDYEPNEASFPPKHSKNSEGKNPLVIKYLHNDIAFFFINN